MRINLIVGDYGGDGHCVTKEFLYQVEGVYSKQELVDYHEIGCYDYLGCALTSQCDDYEEGLLTPEFRAALSAFSVPVPEELGAEEFAELYFQIALLACPSITWSRIKGENIDVGGYGLFYN